MVRAMPPPNASPVLELGIERRRLRGLQIYLHFVRHRPLDRWHRLVTDEVLIEVLYDCRGCGLRDQPLAVRERRGDEDVVVWMDFVTAAISDDHACVSPFCRAGVFDLKIPLPKIAQRLGEASRQ